MPRFTSTFDKLVNETFKEMCDFYKISSTSKKWEDKPFSIRKARQFARISVKDMAITLGTIPEEIQAIEANIKIVSEDTYIVMFLICYCKIIFNKLKVKGEE